METSPCLSIGASYSSIAAIYQGYLKDMSAMNKC